MQLSRNWIRQYVSLPEVTPKELALALTMATVEVEAIIDQAKELEGVVVGRVLDVVKHPQADRLWVCRVDIKREILQIICGGSNLSKGMLVAVATVGSRVHWHGKGESIALEKAKIRGVESNGMIAAANELGLQRLFPLASEHEILDMTGYKVRVGEPLAGALGFDDAIFVIDNKSMTHRPDLWGQYGLAREIAALYDKRLKPLKIPPLPKPIGETLPLEVVVSDPSLCPRYAVVVVDSLAPEPSPFWLRKELETLGLKSVNSVVDVTNYVMASIGQPLHAFDYDRVEGAKIVVAKAGKKVRFRALNVETYGVSEETLLVNDEKRPIALAGIIGGADSSINADTRRIVIEAANFNAASVRRTTMALGLRTDASSRFEKQLDPELVPQALAMAVDLLLRLHPSARVASNALDVVTSQSRQTTLEVNHDFLVRRLGFAIDPKIVIGLLKRLAFGVSHKRGHYTIIVPTFRSRDISIPEDIVEEVARLHRYDSIEPHMPVVSVPAPSKDARPRIERALKGLLTQGMGYDELYNYSFSDAYWSERLGLDDRSAVRVANALASEQQALRTTLLPGLLRRAADNLRWRDRLSLFEMGRVFLPDSGEYGVGGSIEKFLPRQPQLVAGLIVRQGASGEDARLFLQAKGHVEKIFSHFGIDLTFEDTDAHRFSEPACVARIHKSQAGSFGLMKKDVVSNVMPQVSIAWWEFDFAMLLKYADQSRRYVPLPKYPFIERDISMIVDAKVQWAMIERALQGVSPILKRIRLFDVFASDRIGKDKKSIAFRLEFARDDRTLEAKEVEDSIAKLSAVLEKAFHAVIR
ncbi:MAG: phenylalanine--tRNA ligase subunit beta [Patescibacteria group bacterium]